ncbi:MAG TPA: hypothetical protein PK155_07390 [Bacteroidales bacterium]|jgi:hypothetical protein|nr:hypothetical protein [Syntrophorhabdus sp.]HQA93835.1 hypothetical protein [Bacteroidales bacterium]
MDDWEQEFPVVDSFRNAAGQRIDFNISVIQTPSGYTVKAEETEESKCDRFGYQFESFATDSPFTALWDLRGKIKKELSIKYVDDHGEHLSLTHDEIEGRICYSKEDDSIVIETDGDKITMKEFWSIISSYEGFEISLKIKSV